MLNFKLKAIKKRTDSFMIPQKFITFIVLIGATMLGYGQEEHLTAVQYLEDQLAQARSFKKERQYEKARDYLEIGIEKSAGKISKTNTLNAETHLLLGEIYRYLGEYEQALTTLEKSHSFFEQATNVTAIQWGQVNNLLGLVNTHFRNLEVGQIQLEKAINYFKNSKEKATKELGIALCNLGNLLFFKTEMKAALANFQQGGVLLIKERAAYDDLTRYYNGMGMIYSFWGDFEKSLDYYQKALEASLHGEASTPRHTAVLYLNISNCYRKLNQIKQARSYANKAATIFKNLYGKNHYHYSRTLRKQGVIEATAGNPALAIELLLESKNILQHFYKGQRTGLPKIYLHLIDTYLQLNQPQKAWVTYEEGMALLKNKKIVTWLLKRADILSNLGQYPSAITAIDTALVRLHFDKNTLSDIDDNYKAQRVLDCLERRGKFNWKLYQKEQNIASLKSAKKAYDLAIQILDNIRNNIQTESSKQFAYEKYYAIFSGAITVLWQLHESTGEKTYVEQAYMLAEKSKSLVLAEALEQNKLKTKTNIPLSILNRERQLKNAIALYEQQRFEENEKSRPNPDQLLFLNDQIFYTKNDLYALQDSIATHFFPTSQIADKNLITVSDVPSLFSNEQTALIEYFVTDTTLHSFTFYQGNYHWEVTKIPFEFKSKLIGYCQDLTDFSKTPNQTNSQWFAQLLLEKPLKHLPTRELRKLIIIPDNFLGYLPFEILPSLTSQNDYLIEDFEISYAYAAHLLKKQNEITSTRANKIWGGFAPTYEVDNPPLAQISRSKENRPLRNLPGAQVETRTIGNSFKGDFFIGSTVSENTFKKYASDYRILHLSMHAEIDDSHPSFSHFVFPAAIRTDEKALTAAELSNLPLNAELAVLSACNTGFGTIKKGEGIMSLSRAFMYAGVPATIMSLWQVPDAATSKLMTIFYEYLQQGVSKDAALRQAKLDYLANTFSPEQRHPFYWAGFIATGNMQAIKTDDSLPPLISPTLVSLVLGLLGIWIFRKRQ